MFLIIIMNISLTPLEDAWSKPKKKEKQKKEAQQIPLPITMSDVDKTDKMPIAVQPLFSQKGIQEFVIKNENVLELLKPYKTEYVNNLVENLLYNHFNKNEFDMFSVLNSEESGIYILFLCLISMMIIDMIIRHRYK